LAVCFDANQQQTDSHSSKLGPHSLSNPATLGTCAFRSSSSGGSKVVASYARRWRSASFWEKCSVLTTVIFKGRNPLTLC